MELTYYYKSHFSLPLNVDLFYIVYSVKVKILLKHIYKNGNSKKLVCRNCNFASIMVLTVNLLPNNQ